MYHDAAPKMLGAIGKDAEEVAANDRRAEFKVGLSEVYAHVCHCHRDYATWTKPASHAYHQSATEHALHAKEVVGIEEFEDADEPCVAPAETATADVDCHLRIEVEKLRSRRHNDEDWKQHEIRQQIDSQVFRGACQAVKSEAPLRKQTEEAEAANYRHRTEGKRADEAQVILLPEHDVRIGYPRNISVESLSATVYEEQDDGQHPHLPLAESPQFAVEEERRNEHAEVCHDIDQRKPQHGRAVEIGRVYQYIVDMKLYLSDDYAHSHKKEEQVLLPAEVLTDEAHDVAYEAPHLTEQGVFPDEEMPPAEGFPVLGISKVTLHLVCLSLEVCGIIALHDAAQTDGTVEPLYVVPYNKAHEEHLALLKRMDVFVVPVNLREAPLLATAEHQAEDVRGEERTEGEVFVVDYFHEMAFGGSEILALQIAKRGQHLRAALFVYLLFQI